MNAETKKVFFEKLFTGYGKIKTYIKPFYETDKELLDSPDELYSCILSVLNGSSESTENLGSLRKNFEDKYLKFDWAHQKYVQKQKESNYINSDKAFDSVYYDFVRNLK